MNVRQLRISRRTVGIAAALVGMVSLAIGAHAALNKRSLDAAKAIATEQNSDSGKKASRLALVIGNGHYPDASAPLAQPINDARGLTAALRGNGFDVDVVEDATRDDMARAIGRLKAKIKPDTVVMLFFGGYGVQVGRESFMIPVDAAIWKEADVRRDGISVESVLDAIKEQGAKAKLVVLDASRRNPYERRFRSFSHGLAPISPPENALVLSSATPGKVADDSTAEQRAGDRAAQQSDAPRPAPKPPSTRPASRSPAPPKASRCRRSRPRCWKTSASARRRRPIRVRASGVTRAVAAMRSRINCCAELAGHDYAFATPTIGTGAQPMRKLIHAVEAAYLASASPSPAAPDRLRGAARRPGPPRCRLRQGPRGFRPGRPTSVRSPPAGFRCAPAAPPAPPCRRCHRGSR